MLFGSMLESQWFIVLWDEEAWSLLSVLNSTVLICDWDLLC